MGVLRDWTCLGHGNFESSEDEPLCPVGGCNTVRKVFLQPPGFTSSRTQNIDRTLDSLARSHGMTDIQNRGGRAAKGETPGQRQRAEEFNAYVREKYGSNWQSVAKGGTMNAQTKEITGTGPGAAASLAQYHAKPDDVLTQVKDAGALVPKPVLVRQDHENLKISDARPPA